MHFHHAPWHEYVLIYFLFQKLAKTNLVEFSSLVDLYEALGRLVGLHLKYQLSCSALLVASLLMCKSLSRVVRGVPTTYCVLLAQFMLTRTWMRNTVSEANVSITTVNKLPYHGLCSAFLYIASQKRFHEAGFDAFCAGFGELDEQL